MTNPEKVISEQQQASNDSTPEQEISNYAATFCQTMAQLNAVSLGQTQGLLEIAVRAAEKFHSLNSSAAANRDELDGFINQIQSAAESFSQNNQPTPENLSSAQSAANPETFLAAIEQALGNAVRNSVTNQQQLNVLGAAILAQAAALLLSAGEKQN
jgi:hypothetical protein